MKKVLLLLTIVFISACCHFTSQDCGCQPPDPALHEETLKWIAPYEGQNYFVFRDDSGNVDSLRIVRVSDTEFCGGDECGSDCRRERVTLTSVSHPDLKFVSTATTITTLRINEGAESDKFIVLELNVLDNGVYWWNENTSAVVLNDFDWNNQLIEVLDIRCENGTNCNDYAMKKIVISKDFGLLEYTTKDGVEWRKID